MLDFFERNIERLGKAEYALTVLLFLTMLALMLIQVACRYVFKLPLGWSEEALRFMFVAATYMGAAIATKERAHIEINVVEVIVEKKTQDPQKRLRWALIVNLVRDLITTGFLVFMTREIWFYLLDIHAYKTISTALLMPMWIVVGFMFAGILLCMIHSAALIVLNVNGRGPTGFEFGGGDRKCSL